jgi:hypothetical protein
MSERVSFASATGPTLAGIVDIPPGDVRGWGVFSHGFTLGKDCPAASRICKQLAADGIGMLRFVGVGGDQDCAAWLARAQPNPGDVGAVFFLAVHHQGGRVDVGVEFDQRGGHPRTDLVAAAPSTLCSAL